MQCTRIHSSEQTVQNNVQGERNGMSKHFMNIQARRSFVWSRHRVSIGFDQSSRIEHNWPPRAFAVLSIVEVFGWHCCSTAVTGACTWHGIVNNTRHVSIPAPINKRALRSAENPVPMSMCPEIEDDQTFCRSWLKLQTVRWSRMQDSSKLFPFFNPRSKIYLSTFMTRRIKYSG